MVILPFVVAFLAVLLITLPAVKSRQPEAAVS